MLRSIMVEMGGSRYAAAAMVTAVRLAKAFGAQIRALACIDERSVHSEEIRNMLEEHVRASLDDAAARCRKAGVQCISDLVTGDRRAALVRFSRKADLLVVGEPPSEPDAVGFSPVASSIAREAVRDVLFVGQKAPTFQSIVVGYAGQENSCDALRLGAHLAEKANGTVHVVTSEHDVPRAFALQTFAMDYLRAFKVSAARRQASGEPADAILGVANEVGADTVAVGAYRMTKLHALAFGSTALQVLESSPAAVLICR